MNEKRLQNLKTLIGESISEATMAWNPIPSGVFDSVDAERIATNLYSTILKLVEEELQSYKQVSEEMAENLDGRYCSACHVCERCDSIIKSVLQNYKKLRSV